MKLIIACRVDGYYDVIHTRSLPAGEVVAEIHG